MCFPGRGTHITGDMCFPGRRTHITSDMCIPGRGTHIIRNYTPINFIVHFSLKEVKPSLSIAKLIKLVKCDNLLTSLQHFHKKAVVDRILQQLPKNDTGSHVHTTLF